MANKLSYNLKYCSLFKNKQIKVYSINFFSLIFIETIIKSYFNPFSLKMLIIFIYLCFFIINYFHYFFYFN